MEQTPHNQNQENQLQVQQPAHTPAPVKRNRTKTIIWIIVAIALVVAAIVYSFYYGAYQAERQFITSVDSTAYVVDSVQVDGWASPEDYAYWQNATFPIAEYNTIPTPFRRAMVKIFMDNGYLNKESDEIYFLTKIKDRAYRVIAYGDFTGQGDKEMAFLLERSDFRSSALFIIPQNGNILFWKKLPDELPTIKSFKKGALIYMDKMELVPAPVGGIIKQTKYNKYVIIYNKQTKTFDEYYQYTKEDLEEAIHGDEPEEEENMPADTTKAG